MISDFSSSDVDDRASAAASAGSYYDHPDKYVLVPYLVEALLDVEYGGGGTSVRMHAADSIGRLGIYDERAIKILISWLDDESVRGAELLEGIHTLEVFADHASDATPGLIRVMMNPPPSYSPHIQQAAVRALGAIGDPVAVPYLLSVFLSEYEQSWVRKSVAISLAYYGPEARCTVPHLVPLLDAEDPEVRSGAAIVISQATGNPFPDSESRNWDPERLGAWISEKGPDGEQLIVAAAKKWWQEVGRHQEWSTCDPEFEEELEPPMVKPTPTTPCDHEE
jgi:HEAT repeat protein